MSDPQPQCIGIILDGNRRWAKREGLPTLEGHRRGSEVFESCIRWVRDRGIANLAVYAFSTENWNRKEDEVAYLMNLFREIFEKRFDQIVKEGARVRFIGAREMLPEDLQKSMTRVEEASAQNSRITIWICMSYGSRAEITAAAKSIEESKEEITEATMRNHFWSANMPDLDIVIRTGGRHRLSNFLLWQAAYSELFFLDTLWPDFSEKELDNVLHEFNERTRTFGV